MRLIWTSEAIRKLEDIRYYLEVEQQEPVAAINMMSRLVNRAATILDAPLSGRRVPDYNDANVREVLVNSYRIIYYVTDNEIAILSVMHQRQLLPIQRDMMSALQGDERDDK